MAKPVVGIERMAPTRLKSRDHGGHDEEPEEQRGAEHDRGDREPAVAAGLVVEAEGDDEQVRPAREEPTTSSPTRLIMAIELWRAAPTVGPTKRTATTPMTSASAVR